MPTNPTLPITMHFDVNDLWATVYGRATTHADGAPLRAALAQGAAQLIDAVSFDLLRPVDPEDTLDTSKIAGFPLGVFRQGTIVPTQRNVNIATCRWFLYDEMSQGYRRINRLVPLFARAYAGEPLQLSVRGMLREITLSLSGATVDRELGLRMCYITVSGYV
jgi:hypothetical protein